MIEKILYRIAYFLNERGRHTLATLLREDGSGIALFVEYEGRLKG